MPIRGVKKVFVTGGELVPVSNADIYFLEKTVEDEDRILDFSETYPTVRVCIVGKEFFLGDGIEKRNAERLAKGKKLDMVVYMSGKKLS